MQGSMLLLCALLLSHVAMLPSIAVISVPVLPPCTSVLNPFRFAAAKQDFSIECYSNQGKEQGADVWDDLQKESENRERGRSYYSRTEIGNDADNSVPDRPHQERRSEPSFAAKEFGAVQSSEFMFLMARPGYSYNAPAKAAVGPIADLRVGSVLPNLRWPSLGGSLFLSHMLAREGRSVASIHTRKVLSANASSACVERKAASDSACTARAESLTKPHLSVSEGSARLKELSALMRSLRTFQSKFENHDVGAKDGIPQLQGLLEGFARLKLHPPASLVSTIPAPSELKGELIARLGGLSGRFELANTSLTAAMTKPRHRSHPILIPKVLIRPVLRRSKALRDVEGGPGSRKEELHSAQSRPVRTRSWHAPRVKQREVPMPPPDDWLEVGDRDHKAFVTVVARFLDHAASVGDGESLNPDVVRSSPFWAHKRPKVSLEEYCARIAKFSACSSGNFLLATIYLDRFLANSPGYVVSGKNVHRLLLTSVLVATKQWDDQHYNNAFWAKAGGISNAELNTLESALLAALDWRLHVDKPEFDLFQDLTTRLGRALGCFPLAQSQSTTSDEPELAPCSGADARAVSDSPVVMSAAATQRLAPPSEGQPPPALAGLARPLRCAAESDSSASPPWSGPPSPSAQRRRPPGPTACSAAGGGAASAAGRDVLDSTCLSDSGELNACVPCAEAAGDTGGGGVRVGVGSGGGGGEDFDLEVLKERLQSMKEARLFRRSPPAEAGSEARAGDDAGRDSGGRSGGGGGDGQRWGRAWDRRTPRTSGPLFAAMERMLAETLQSGQAGLGEDAAGQALGLRAGRTGRPSAGDGDKLQLAAGGGRRPWGGVISVDVVEGLEPVPAA